ncbi:hypothetical protein IFR04_006493 [Cadophora malorum]|uniref:Uncharacterized protein n=1 Tax=Cadophora malorum TaxID=108018 RepID=A0A8H7TK36_9HELO|nr:hypothetical protein IFR04_006493 [Cadophora malorum]
MGFSSSATQIIHRSTDRTLHSSEIVWNHAPHIPIRRTGIKRIDDERRIGAADEIFPKYSANEEEILPSGAESISRDDFSPRYEFIFREMAISRADFDLQHEISTDESRFRRDGGSDHGADYGISHEFDFSLDSRQEYDSDYGIDGTNSEIDPEIDYRNNHGTDDGTINELDSSLDSRREYESEDKRHRKFPSRTNARFEHGTDHGIRGAPQSIADCKHEHGIDYGINQRVHLSADSRPGRYGNDGTDYGFTYKSQSNDDCRCRHKSDYGTSDKSVPSLEDRHEN